MSPNTTPSAPTASPISPAPCAAGCAVPADGPCGAAGGASAGAPTAWSGSVAAVSNCSPGSCEPPTRPVWPTALRRVLPGEQRQVVVRARTAHEQHLVQTGKPEHARDEAADSGHDERPAPVERGAVHAADPGERGGVEEGHRRQIEAQEPAAGAEVLLQRG